MGAEQASKLLLMLGQLDGVEFAEIIRDAIPHEVQGKPEYNYLARDIARLATRLLEEAGSINVAEEPRVLVTEYVSRSGQKSLVIADTGDGYVVAAIVWPSVAETLVPILRRIVSGNTLRCPSCNEELDYKVYTCPNPSCGKRIPFTATRCPFCGTDVSVKKCPNCGKMLKLYDSRVEAYTEEEAKEAGVATAPKASTLGLGLAGLGAAIYFGVVAALGLPLADSILAGIVPIIIGFVNAIKS